MSKKGKRRGLCLLEGKKIVVRPWKGQYRASTTSKIDIAISGKDNIRRVMSWRLSSCYLHIPIVWVILSPSQLVTSGSSI